MRKSSFIVTDKTGEEVLTKVSPFATNESLRTFSFIPNNKKDLERKLSDIMDLSAQRAIMWISSPGELKNLKVGRFYNYLDRVEEYYVIEEEVSGGELDEILKTLDDTHGKLSFIITPRPFEKIMECAIKNVEEGMDADSYLRFLFIKQAGENEKTAYCLNPNISLTKFFVSKPLDSHNIRCIIRKGGGSAKAEIVMLFPENSLNKRLLYMHAVNLLKREFEDTPIESKIAGIEIQSLDEDSFLLSHPLAELGEWVNSEDNQSAVNKNLKQK